MFYATVPLISLFVFFFFKQKTAYEMRISDWSSDVCSSDLWAMRLTYSGEFIHAAPWSVGSQGSANVSHGCTGMSTENAGWLYDMTLRGDVVEYVGTDRPMEPYNGYGDWNIPWSEYAAGSAPERDRKSQRLNPSH